MFSNKKHTDNIHNEKTASGDHAHSIPEHLADHLPSTIQISLQLPCCSCIPTNELKHGSPEVSTKTNPTIIAQDLCAHHDIPPCKPELRAYCRCGTTLYGQRHTSYDIRVHFRTSMIQPGITFHVNDNDNMNASVCRECKTTNVATC